MSIRIGKSIGDLDQDPQKSLKTPLMTTKKYDYLRKRGIRAISRSINAIGRLIKRADQLGSTRHLMD
jgi:hypothetical protein